MSEDVYDAALDAIRAVFADTSVGVEITILSLQSLSQEIDVMIDALHQQRKLNDD